MTMRNVWGRGFSLGAISASQQTGLIDSLELEHRKLDQLMAVLSEARAQGITEDAVHPYLATLEELRAALVRLNERVGILESEDDVAAWHAEHVRLSAAVDGFVAEARVEFRAMQASSKVTIGIWVGAAVLGAVGTVLLVRWYGSKRRR